ncbi:diaminobutyrate--2-oxoglutarate transaminase family protein (plasmid) [Streptomyces sp. NBC_01591]|uniref:diaminobutyrate--2-oxoglutarate transaminase family protein n=1 Tax=Streptomyces sp. NBC_01591 TaxID=2975888 RepID=UPI002DD99B57|nr:diaminobutyrate--2-oxoglutarate transaminase family protein [Streptomyces sp. NBC_01591]WSD73890.1 diaminobutyrate--2-oxoglutarate transaminase family protein [Streptomyces sp. NBC_01591]
MIVPTRLPASAYPAPARTQDAPRYRGPSVRGPLPGPRSAELLERQARRESNARTYPRRLPFAVKRGEGSFLEDLDGNVFLDFLSGAGVLPLGHNPPEPLAAAHRQLDELVHGLDFPTPVKDEFTELTLGMLPGSMPSRTKIHFCGPTGANAVEAALKLCKTATGRTDVISFQGGFHGSSLATLSITGLVAQKAPVGGRMPGVHFFPYAHCHRCPLGLKRNTCAVNCAGYLERSLTDPNGGIPLPAAVILELVQGEGGVIPADPEFVRRLWAVTRELDIPLIVDEVQSGCGRTGTWFAFEQYGIEPDVVVASKALSGVGLPAAVILYDKRLDVWLPGAHSGTFRGNQAAFAAGVATIEAVRRDGVLANVRERSAQLTRRLTELRALTPRVSDIRGLGLMTGVELADPATGEPASELALHVQREALLRGLIIELGGRDDGVLRLLPPLNCTAAEVDTAVDILHAALSRALMTAG